MLPGKTFRPQGMLSTSSAGAVAQREGNVAITIQAAGKRGRDISAISKMAGKDIRGAISAGHRVCGGKSNAGRQRPNGGLERAVNEK